MPRLKTSSPQLIAARAADDKRTVELTKLFKAESVQTLSPVELVALQEQYRNGSEYGTWLTPRELMPGVPGESRYIINLADRLHSYLRQFAALEEVRKDYLADPWAQKYVASLLAPPEELVRKAVLNLTRYLLLCRRGPSRKASNTLSLTGGGLDASTCSAIAYTEGPCMYALAIAKALRAANPKLDAPTSVVLGTGFPAEMFAPDDGLLHLVDGEDLASVSTFAKKSIEAEWRRMAYMAHEGLWTDRPAAWTSPTRRASEAEVAVKRAFESSDPHQPLPDEYFAVMATRALWVLKHLRAGLFEVLEQIPRIFHEATAPSLQADSNIARRRESLEQFLRAYVWRDADGKVIRNIPFPLRLSGRGGPNAIDALNAEDTEEEDAAAEATDIGDGMPWAQTWPPRRFTDIIVLAATLQRASLFIVGVCLGSRSSENVALTRGCVTFKRDGKARLTGLTFKFADRESGDVKDWPLPVVAQTAVAIQVELARLAERVPALGASEVAPLEENAQQADDSERPLWIQLGSCGSGTSRLKGLVGIGPALKGFARTLGMDPQPGGQVIRPHRLRKTLARLVALALVDAPTILMDVFGHKSLAQTMYYVLTDKAFAADLEATVREVVVARGTELVESIVEREVAKEDAKIARATGRPASAGPDNPLGGRGGEALQRAVVGARAEKHRTGEHWQAKDSRQLANRLTLSGTTFMLVRPGVFCTRSPGSPPGPCNFKLGRPDPAACQPTCDNRAEAEFLRPEVIQTIEAALDGFRQAVEDKKELTAVWWANQALGHIERFPDIKAKYSDERRVLDVTAWLDDQAAEDEEDNQEASL